MCCTSKYIYIYNIYTFINNKKLKITSCMKDMNKTKIEYYIYDYVLQCVMIEIWSWMYIHSHVDLQEMIQLDLCAVVE